MLWWYIIIMNLVRVYNFLFKKEIILWHSVEITILKTTVTMVPIIPLIILACVLRTMIIRLCCLSIIGRELWRLWSLSLLIITMATIVGGMSQKLSRKTAAEFSFFLAVPTMAAASGYKLLKAFMTEGGTEMLANNLSTLIIGNIVAFIVAILAIKFFISFLTKYGFKAFGYYRIVVGLLILILLFCGVPLEVA